MGNAKKKESHEHGRYKVYFYIVWVMFIAITVQMLSEVLMNKRDMLDFILVFVVLQVPMIITFFINRKGVKPNVIMYMTIPPVLITWAYIFLTSETFLAFTMIFPVIGVLMFIGRKNLILVTGIINLIISFIKIYNNSQNAAMTALDKSTYSYAVFLIILFTASSYIGAKISDNMKKRNRTMISNLERSKAEQDIIMKKLIESSQTVFENSEELNAIMNEMDGMSKEMALAVEQIKEGAKEGAEDTQQQLESTTNIQEMINEANDASIMMGKTSDKIEEVVSEGKNIVQKLYKNNQYSNENNKNTHLVIQELQEKSKNIVAIIETINSIADQTNLLALNAAIEAARVGEAGKGFAVVADEIRKLAEESSHSANDITNIITQLQEQTQKSVEASNKANEISIEQNRLVETTKEIFDNIEKDIQDTTIKTSLLITKIEAVVKENQNIVSSTNNLSAIAEENYSSSESTVALTERYLSLSDKGNHLADKLMDTAKELAQQNN